MDTYRRAVSGAVAGLVAAGFVAASLFVLDLVRLQPFATPGALSGAFFGPGGYAWDFTSLSGLIAAVVVAYQIATFTMLHFLLFSLAGVLAGLLVVGAAIAGQEPSVPGTDVVN